MRKRKEINFLNLFLFLIRKEKTFDKNAKNFQKKHRSNLLARERQHPVWGMKNPPTGALNGRLIRPPVVFEDFPQDSEVAKFKKPLKDAHFHRYEGLF